MKKFVCFFTALLALTASAVSYGQTLQVTGSVKDAGSGEPLPGATVLVKGTTNGVSTGIDGRYSIAVPSDGTLVFSTVGFAAAEVAVGGRRVIDVALNPDSEFLDETIVVAFGTSTRESFTGAAKVLDDDLLQKSTVTSVTNALAGAVPGVQLTSSNGAPNATPTIRIRGIGSISAGNDPLIVVDGAPYGGSLNNINPSDIESLTVLKDAASNALYGARGANGVIMITTKRAKRGDAVVTFDAKIGANTKALKEYVTLRDPAQYYEQHYKALYNYYIAQGDSPNQAWSDANSVITGSSSSGGLGYNVYNVPNGQYLIGSDGKLNPNATLGNIISYKGEDYLVIPDDWSDEAYRTGIRQEYNVSVSAGEGKSTFYAALGYLNNEGITKASDMERITGRLKADYQAKSWLKVGANASFAHYNYNSLGNNGSSTSTGNIWAYTSQLAPIYPLYVRNADGSIKIDDNGFKIMDYGSGQNAGLTRSYFGDSNALMDTYLNTRNSEGNSANVNAFADIDILPGLKLTINGTSYLSETRYKWVYNPYYGQFDSTGGTIEVEHDRYITYNLQQLLNYNRKFGLHNVGIMLGHEYYNAKSYDLYASKSQMFDQKIKELSGAVVDGKSSGSSMSTYNNEGFFARALYDYGSKYFASLSIRRDASSRFDPDNRWGTFWSAGGAWIASKEPWFDVPAIDEFKVKASIGSQGNDNIGSYMYTDTYDILNSNGSPATTFASKGNKDITWETNTNANAGIEFGLLGRITGSVDLFNRKTTDMLFNFPVASSLGYSSYYANVGDMYNRGIEIDLGASIVDTKDIKVSVNGNLTYFKNKITMLDEEKKTIVGHDLKGKTVEGYQSGSFFIGEGIPYYSFYMKEFAGVDPETGESLWYMDVYQKDDNGENVLDEKGNPILESVTTTNSYSKASYYINNKTGLAPVYGGFGTTVQAYGFDFSINFSYQIGGYRYDSQYASFMSSPAGNNIGYNYHVDLLKAWTPENKDSDIPRFQYGDTYSAGTSTRFLTKASYLNIENLNLGYTIPAKITNKVNISSLRIYVAAENLGYWSMRKGFDPRQSYTSADATSYSPMRTVSGGVTVKF